MFGERKKKHYLFYGLIALLLSGCTAPFATYDADKSRGSYRGSYYEVKAGDTLYFISYITDKDIHELIQYNHLEPPYTIYPGQKIQLWRPRYLPPVLGLTDSSTATSTVKWGQKPDVVPQVPPLPSTSHTLNSRKNVISNSNKNEIKVNHSQNKHDEVKKYPKKSVEQKNTKGYRGSRSTSKLKQSNLQDVTIKAWRWPTKGRIIKSFALGNQGNKGIDIAGQRGQPVVSAAPGTVVYSGNALRGYGNLVIIKHNDDYISAYAHNAQLLVREGQSVTAGQKIATMGSSGTNSVRLHFEIRYQGKPVNPKRYLP